LDVVRDGAIHDGLDLLLADEAIHDVTDDTLICLTEGVDLAAELFESFVPNVEASVRHGWAFTMHQLVERDLKNLCELDDMVELRFALSGFPA
jgi:hypothetical protein